MSQDYEGYIGHAGNTLERWYHKSVIAIWPTDLHYEIVAQLGLEFAVGELLKMRADLVYLTDEELEPACDDCQQLAEAIINHWPSMQYVYANRIHESPPWLQQYANELPKFDDPDLIENFLGMIAKRDWSTNLDSFVITALKRMGVDDILPLLKQLLKFEPPPNEYGIQFLKGLATRDAQWLLKLAQDKKTGGLSKGQLDELLSIAVNKLATHACCIAEEKYERSQRLTESWFHLQHVAIVARNEQVCQRMLMLVADLPGVFDFRTFQVPSAVKLCGYAKKEIRWRDSRTYRELDKRTQAEIIGFNSGKTTAS